MEVVKIGNNELQIKVYEGQRVVTFKDIDRVHERETETAKYRFRDNKKHFIPGVDYFEITRKDVGANFATTYGFSNKAPKGILLTESGIRQIQEYISRIYGRIFARLSSVEVIRISIRYIWQMMLQRIGFLNGNIQKDKVT